MEDESMPQANDNHITPIRRKRIEDQIERLIAFLDAADAPTEDLEPIGDEADTGWPERYGAGARHGMTAGNEDDEPELGWTGDVDQTRALRHYIRCEEHHHAETQHDGREPCLGSLDGEIDQERWAGGDGRDLEADYVGYPAGRECSFTADMEAVR
jgi:hypothetical protein